MSEIEKKPSVNKNDEIDLIELFQNIFNWVKNAFTLVIETLLRIFLFYVRKTPYIIGFMIIGAIVGFLIFKSTPRYYSTEMLIKPNSVSNADLVHFINKISFKGDVKTVSHNYNIDSTTAINIKDIKASWIVDENKDGIGDYVDYEDEFNINDTTKRRLYDRLNIKVEVFDTSSLSKLSDGISYYIDNVPYFQEIHTNRILQLKEDLYKINIELSELDSLQALLYFKKKQELESMNNMLVLNEKQEQLLHGQVLSLFNQKQSIEKTLRLYPEIIKVIQNFTPFTQAENNIIKLISLWTGIFFIIGVILLGVIRQLRNIRDIVKKY